MNDRAIYWANRLHNIRQEHGDLRKWSVEWSEEQNEYWKNLDEQFEAKNPILFPKETEEEKAKTDAIFQRAEELEYDWWEEHHKYD